VTLAELAAVPTVLGVAAGREKLSGVRGALRSGALDVLVCDRSLALALLDPALPADH
jgi:DNA-binding transcriptional regulator LsrR (DeoR family)